MGEGRSDGTVLLATGILFWMVAAYFIYSGFKVDVAYEGVANLHAMHIQTLNFHTGIGAAVVGTLMLCTAAILGSLSQPSPRPSE